MTVLLRKYEEYPNSWLVHWKGEAAFAWIEKEPLGYVVFIPWHKQSLRLFFIRRKNAVNFCKKELEEKGKGALLDVLLPKEWVAGNLPMNEKDKASLKNESKTP